MFREGEEGGGGEGTSFSTSQRSLATVIFLRRTGSIIKMNINHDWTGDGIPWIQCAIENAIGANGNERKTRGRSLRQKRATKEREPVCSTEVPLSGTESRFRAYDSHLPTETRASYWSWKDSGINEKLIMPSTKYRLRNWRHATDLTNTSGQLVVRVWCNECEASCFFLLRPVALVILDISRRGRLIRRR